MIGFDTPLDVRYLDDNRRWLILAPFTFWLYYGNTGPNALRTEESKATYDADTGTYNAVRGPFRSVRVPTYRQFDARVEKQWLYNTWSLGLYLDVINVANFENIEAIEYDYRYRYKAPVTSFPILPTLGVRGTW